MPAEFTYFIITALAIIAAGAIYAIIAERNLKQMYKDLGAGTKAVLLAILVLIGIKSNEE
jgi:FtsH-binding integral membrane protein